MDPVQLALIILGLVAIAGGVLALIAAIWTLRARPTRSVRPAEPPPFARREPTLDRSEQISRAAATSSAPPRPAPGLAANLDSGLSNPKAEVDDDEDEDDIPTTVLSASAFADLDDMIAAIDDLDTRDSS